MQPADVTVLEWSSSDPELVHVDAKGVISGLAAGTATITARISEEESQTMTVTVSSSYQDGQSGHYYIDGAWYTLDKTANTATVTYRGSSYSAYTNEYTGSVTIPASVSYNGEEYGVTSIGTSAFSSCSGLTTISLPNSVTSIDKDAFYKCNSLTTISLPNSVTSIGSSAFYGCDNLVNFEIEDITGLCRWGATTYGSPLRCNTLDKHLFIDGEEITSLVIPESVTQIGIYAFYKCCGLTSISLPNSVTSIGTNAFNGCSGLTRINVVDKSALMNWGANTPMKCNELPKHIYVDGEELKSLTIGSRRSIPSYSYYTACIESLTLPDDVTIEANAFGKCLSLAHVYANSIASFSTWGPNTPMTANDSPKHVYADGEEITSLEVSGDMVIGESAFRTSCLNELTLTSSSATISASAFALCKDLKTVSCLLQTPPALLNANAFTLPTTVVVPADALEKYTTTNIWKDLAATKQLVPYNEYNTRTIDVVAEDLMSAIHKYIGDQNLDKVVNLTVRGTINSYDFMVIRDKMPALKSLDLSEATIVANSYEYYPGYSTKDDELGEYSFYGLSLLNHVVLPKSISAIGKYAFAQSGIESLIVPQSVKSIDEYAFSKCSNLNSISFEDGVVALNKRSFEYCEQLNSISWGNARCNLVGEFAFYECTSLKSLMIPGDKCSLERYSLGYISSVKLSGTFDSFARFTTRCLTSDGKEESSIEELDMRDVIMVNKLIKTDYPFYALHLKELFLPAPTDGIAASKTFDKCNIDKLTLAEGYSTIGSSFMTFGYNKVKYLDLPASLKIIEDNPFGFIDSDGTSLYELSEVTIAPNSQLATIGSRAFSHCSLRNFILPSSVETIERSAFEYNTELESFNIPSNSELITISVSAFRRCSNLKSFTIPSKVTTIESGVFSGCISLKDMVIAPGVQTIPASMMSDCTGLESVSMPSTIRTIGTKAFYGCTNLKTFKVPSSVESIGDQAFYGCSLLNDVYSYTLEPTSIAETTFSTWTTASLHVPYQAFYTYFYVRPWSKFLQKDSFLEDFDYFYANNDITLNSETGTLGGTPEAQLNAGGGLILRDEIGQKLADIHIRHDGSLSASLVYDASLEMIEGARLYMEIDVKANQWYFLCFPYDALLSEVVAPGKYAIRYYDGQERAQNGAGNSWKKLPEDDSYLHAGVGYIFQANAAGTLVVPVSAPDFTNVTRAQDLNTYASAVTANASWNFTGNITPSYYEIGDMQYQAPITIWDGKTYVAYRPEDDVYLLSPFQAFFVQRPVDASTLTFADECRMTYLESQKAMEAKLARRRAAARPLDRLLFNLALSLDSLTDRTRVVYNDRASVGYDMDLDAAKFLSMDNDMPQFYSLDVQGDYCAINERPTADGIVLLGYFAPKAGTYTISAERLDAFCKLHDNLTGKDIDLDLGDYTFQSEAGTFNSRFELRCTASVNGIARIYEETGVSLQGGKGQLVVKGVADQPVRIFSLNGEEVTTCSHDGVVSLPQGVYVATIGKVSTKVMIK